MESNCYFKQTNSYLFIHIFFKMLLSFLQVLFQEQQLHLLILIVNKYQTFSQSLNQIEMQDDDIIGFLNNQGTSKFKHAKPKKKIQGYYTNQVNPQPQQQSSQDMPFTQNFQNLYEARMQKVKRKNQIKQLQQKKKLQIIQATKKNYPQPKLINADEPIKLPTIRYLVFKNWSGSHLNYQVVDNGYKFKFTNGTIGLIKHLLQQNGFVQSTDNEGHMIWNVGVPSPNIYQSMTAYQKINHFPKSFQITRKDLMLQNLSKMKSRFPTHYNYYPQTYILPAQASAFMEHAQKSKNSDKWFIVKPSNKSQGKGIWITNKPEQILKKQKDCIVVSEYINNPLLVNNLKFDMRIYVAITCWNPLRIYIFDDGLTRFATSEYSSDLTSKQNLYVHLTNYSVNKMAQNFVANDDIDDSCKGHKWSLPALKDYLKNNGYDVQLIWSRIQDIVVKTIISIENTVYNAMEMQVPYRDNCFQLLGFDILIDDNLRPWLVEINLSPSLNTDSALDLKIKGNMISDLFTMIGIVSLDQRFSVDKTYLLNSNKMFASKQFRNQMSKLQRLVLRQSDQQIKRSGGWKRIFPTQTAIRYKGFFDIDRPLNRLLREEQLKRLRNQKNFSYNQAIKQINANPQNNNEKRLIPSQLNSHQNTLQTIQKKSEISPSKSPQKPAKNLTYKKLQDSQKVRSPVKHTGVNSQYNQSKQIDIKLKQQVYVPKKEVFQKEQINQSRSHQKKIQQAQKEIKAQSQQEAGFFGSIKKFFG